MGLVAPRPLLLTEGTTDYWANPIGTCVTHMATQSIYRFFNSTQHNGIFFHEGGHDHTEEDFSALIDFANSYFFSTPTKKTFKMVLPEAEKFSDAILWDTPKTKKLGSL